MNKDDFTEEELFQIHISVGKSIREIDAAIINEKQTESQYKERMIKAVRTCESIQKKLRGDK